jgi:DNA-binding transcriptional MerR regulator
MAELEAETGFTARTIRYYVARGLLPPAHGRGPTATYDQGHLLRLKAIQLRRGRNQPLDDIKEELARLTDDDIAAELRIETEPPEDRWRRIILHPDIELHVRERGGERDRRVEEAVDWIVGLARSVVDRLEPDT